MSKKKLLEESTIRSFMKLANLQPLTDKFLKESWKEEKSLDEEQLEEGEEGDDDVEEGTVGSAVGGTIGSMVGGALEEVELDEEMEKESAPPDTEETAKSRGRLEEDAEEGAELEEGKESEGRPSSPKQKVKGVAKPGKVKGGHADHKFTPLKAGNHHSDKPDSIEAKTKSNAPKKNNSQFELVSENLQEMNMGKESMYEDMDEAEDVGTASDAADEGGAHQSKMKDLIRQMLENLKQMGEEYGMTMEISDAGESSPEGGEEMTPPAGEEDAGMMQEKLDEMVEKLTKRVAARLVKESKKRR